MLGLSSFIGLDMVRLLRATPDPAFQGRKRHTSVAIYGGNRSRTTGLMGLNGKRECERRMRQIAAGSLRVENGLVLG